MKNLECHDWINAGDSHVMIGGGVISDIIALKTLLHVHNARSIELGSDLEVSNVECETLILIDHLNSAFLMRSVIFSYNRPKLLLISAESSGNTCYVSFSFNLSNAYP